MHTTLAKIATIKANPNNPRIIKDDKFHKLVQSIRDFPKMLEIRPIVVNDDMTVLGGNMRLKACKEAGLTEVPIIKVSELTEDEQKEFIIKDNVGYGEWDYELLGSEWDTEALARWGLDLPDIIEDCELEQDSIEIKDDEPTEIKRGDIIEIGSHRLMCGDSTKSEDIEKLLGKDANGKTIRADMTFCDPPYLMSYQGAMTGSGVKNTKHKVLTNDNLNKEDGDEFLYKFLKNMKEHVTGAFYISFYRLGLDRMFEQMKRAGLQYRNIIIWKKNHKNLSNSDYQAKYEPIVYGYTQDDYIPILYGWNEKHIYRGGKGKQDDVWELDTLWEIDRTKVNDMHPTMKPMELLQRIIQNSSKKRDKVLDLFMGSGTTMVVAHLLNRQCYGIEYEPSYCQVIINRMRGIEPDIEVKVNGEVYEFGKRLDSEKMEENKNGKKRK